MAIQSVRRLRDKWALDEGLAARLGEAFDRVGFTKDYVARRIDGPKPVVGKQKATDIKDNVWGMIELEDSTLRLLDSAIIQRLRGIKQLGFTYLTYPTGEHSRFVHSLGVAHVVSRFLDTCRKRAKDPPGGSATFVDPDRLAPLKANHLVHAAILHDVGHMPFSHASESVLEGRPRQFACGGLPIARFLLDIEVDLEKNLGLSEALSLLIVLSDRFDAYYRGYISPGSTKNDLLFIASLIAGEAPERRFSGIPSIISAAAVDSDKIDYINRDALNCGIPVGVDVERLFLRSGFIRATKRQLENLKLNPVDEEIHFVVNASGVDALEEITDARAALFQRVYLHSVTRTAEAVFNHALRRHRESDDPRLADALDIWSHSDDTLLSVLRDSPSPQARSLADRLAMRELPKKACAFNTLIAEPHMPLGSLPLWSDPANQSAFGRQISNVAVNDLAWEKHPRNREKEARRVEDVERRIREEAEKIRDLIPAWKNELVPGSPLENVLLVRGAYRRPMKQNGFVLQGGDLLRMSDFTTRGEQQEAVDIFKAAGFIMSDLEWRHIVLVAARKVIFSMFGELESTTVETLREQEGEMERPAAPNGRPVHYVRRTILNLDLVIGRASLDRDKVYELMDVLGDVGYFDDAPILARRSHRDEEEIDQIVKKLSTFEGQRSWRVGPEIVLAFVDQFPPLLRPELKRALVDLHYFDAREISASIFEALAPAAPMDIVPLSPTSGTGVWTTLKRAAEEAGFGEATFCTDLRAALSREPSRPLVLVDDNVASATQARAQFLAWLGVPREDWPAELQNEDNLFEGALSPEETLAFKSRPVKVAVCAALPTSEQRLRAELEAQGFSRFLGIGFKHDLGSHNWSPALKAFLADVGRSVLPWSRYEKAEADLSDEERQFCSDMAFGYAGAGGLTATASNIPSSTITALWSPGLHNGSPWMPLMVRQKRLKSLILG